MRAKLLLILIVIGVLGYVAYRYLNKPTQPAATPPVAEVDPRLEEAPVPAPVEPEVAPRPNITSLPKTNMPTPAAPEPVVDWKPKLDEILGSNLSVEQKQQQIREFLATLPDAAAEQAVQSLTLAVKDTEYGFIKPLALDPNLPEAVRDEFMVDLLNRPNSIRVPSFLELARNPDHPDNENAYDMLEIFTNQKLGADWAGWEKAVAGWLKENPDQPRRNRTVGAKPTPPSEQAPVEP